MRKRMKQICTAVLSAAMLLTMAVPLNTQAAAPKQSGHGLTGTWYKALDEGEGIARFQFDENRCLGTTKMANLDGESMKSMIGDMLGSSDDMQFVLAKFAGQLEVPREEDYTFYLTGDDGFRLYIDGELIIDFWVQEWEKTQTSEPITLTQGRHEIEVDYLQGWGGAWLKMEWESMSVARETIPEDALYQSKRISYDESKNALSAAVRNCTEVCSTISGSEETIGALKKEIQGAERVLRENDMDISHFEDSEIDEIIGRLNAAAEKLAAAKAEVYMSTGVQPSAVYDKFSNPLYQGQDPFVTQKDGFYYLVASSNDDSDAKVYVSKSSTLTDQGEKVMVMDMTGKQRRIFAPELFWLDDEDGGHWYIYYCADVLDFAGNYPETAAKYQAYSESAPHMACCLRSKTDDPQGEYEDIGPLYCGENGVIRDSNDFTVMKYKDSLVGMWGTTGICCYARMDSPMSITEDRKKLGCGELDEGPRALINEKTGQIFLTTSGGKIYSSDGYRMNLYRFDGDSLEDFGNNSKWTTWENAFTATSNVSGPARASFVKSADGTEDWMVYHSRVYKEVEDNWWCQNNIKKFTWDEDGTPNFGVPASTNRKYDLPSGDPGQGDQYEAENAILEGGAVFSDYNVNYYGEGYVRVPNSMGAAVSFVVNAKEAGDYLAAVRYAYGVKADGESTNRPTNQLPGRASMNIYVNGKAVDTLQMDKTSTTWDEWFTGTKRLALKEGTNLITYSVEEGCVGNVHLDMLAVRKADVPYTEAAVNPESIAVSNDYAVLEVGESTQIQAAVAPDNAANRSVIYQSDNETVAVVDSTGRVTAKKTGKAVITVSAAGDTKISTRFIVCVTDKKTACNDIVVLPVYVEISEKTAELTTGKTLALNPKVYPASAEDPSVSYASSNPAVAVVDSKGNVTAMAAGMAQITITANGDKTVSQICRVTVSPAKVTGVKASRVKSTGKVKLSWKKQSQADGYEIYRAGTRNGKYKKIKTIKKASVKAWTDKKARKGKTYYYKIAAYKKVDGKKLSGVYSRVQRAR